MNPLHRTLLTAGLLGAFALGAVAQVQTPPQPPASPTAPHMMHGERGMMNHDRRHHRAQRMERRLGMLKQILRIAPQQEAAWTAWTTALQPVRLQRPDRVEFARMTTPQRIDQLKAVQAQRATIVGQRLDATKAFYATLDAEQQRLFDAQGMRFLRAGMGGKRGVGGHPGRHHRG